MLIIVFDVDGTLMGTKSGKAVQTTENDFEVIWRPIIPDGADVYIHTNQLGRLGILSAKKIEAATKMVGAKDALVATARDRSRKPSPFGLLEMIYGDDDAAPVDSDIIIFVGDAAGRPRDHSDTDLKVTLNLRKLGHAAYFVTPRDYDALDVGGGGGVSRRRLKDIQRKSSWTVTYPDFDAPQKGFFTIDDVPEGIKLIIMCGIQGSGKSTIVDALRSDGWRIITYSSKDRTYNAAKKHLHQGSCVVVDGTFPMRSTRKEFISLGGDNVMVIHVTTPEDVAKHNRLYREIIHNAKHIPEVAVAKFARDFEKPSSKEGAVVMRCIPYVEVTTEYGLYFY
jgi:bifunctional polynucleotide phosphatase/kinase